MRIEQGGRNRQYALGRHSIYCPKVIAGIESLPETLQDRCIRIELQRKKIAERVERFMPENYGRNEPLRNQLDAWSIRKAMAVIRAHRDRKGLGVPKEVNDDRVRDILEPLFAVASVLPKWVRQRLAEGAIEICKGRKSEEAESNPVVAAVSILRGAFPKDEKDAWSLRTEDACELLGEIPHHEDKAAVQALLRRLGFRSRNVRMGKHVLRAYRIPKRRLEKLAERYPS
jgi:hypothetical protein